jgi:hypothetical protein
MGEVKYMIEIGENPEKTPNINKFIAKSGDGMRGRVIAIRKSTRKSAIVLALNTSIAKDVMWGKFYLVREVTEGEYPVVFRQVRQIPDKPDWEVVIL